MHKKNIHSSNSATNSDLMKDSNRRLLINIVRKNAVSRAELARLTGLTRAAVTNIVSKLIKDGIFTEIGSAEAKYGRKPVLLDLDPDSYYAVGISITRSGCDIGVMNIKGVLLSKNKVDLDPAVDANGMIGTIIDGVKKILHRTSLPHERILGIGINAPGPLDSAGGRILNPPNFDQWHNVDIVKKFRKYFDVPFFLENNSISLAIAEKNYGIGSEFSSFMLMVVDSGVGGGIIINDSIYRGAYRFGSEVGHASIDFNGELCRCGNRGCLELYASIPSVISKIKSFNKGITAWSEIVDRAEDGDRNCIEAIEQEALYLSYGITNVMNILDLEAVVLTGDIAYKPDIILKAIQNNVWGSVITRDVHKLVVTSSSILKDSDVISAASIVFERFFKGEVL